jgi:hypothetical protein
MIITNLSECEAVWKKHSPNDSIWNDWDVATIFLEKRYKPHFIKLDGGLIPLCLEDDNKYGIYGGEYPENVTFWIDIHTFPKFFELIPQDTVIFDMNYTQVQEILKLYPEYAQYFHETDKQYLLNLEKLDYSIQNYFKTFSYKHRKNINYDLKKVQELPLIEKWGGIEFFDDLVHHNKLRFGEESDFLDEEFLQRMKNFLKYMSDKGHAYFLAIEINGKIEGVEVGVLHNNKYYLINGAANTQIKNLGKHLIYRHIEKAMALKAIEMDFLVGDTGWKELWNLEHNICITFRKGPNVQENKNA